ncbi:DsbC/DsbD-like thiol-disulfide interchange protein [Neorhizobium huautlense]|uniref:DsbC/DsbD-like thiol-disulfide interchange protein n=1 Tax=Neorhizobium huautlense TaxID=67774 RepID=A0ABT9PWL3_9HYPH|nr:protein-disulfide reductase DsbD domain-containing protein [Neorhizobium huautlense]MDP9838279.1 DsbC/DsbD-like thiol-disulfide interchange protein [Neorhizobium huautlense]
MRITLPYSDTDHRFRHMAVALVAAGLCLAASFFPSSRAVAETTPWAQNEGGRMRIVTLPPDAQGRVRGGFEIEPKPGWITYWREPGEAGIPPKLSVAEGSAATIGELSYPVPKRVGDGKLLDIGYDKPVTLPFELTVSDPKEPKPVTLSGFIGLCRDICIPFQADFLLNLKPENMTPPEEFMILQKAGAFLPDPPSMDFAVTHYSLTDADKTLKLALRLPQDTGTKPQVLVTGPEGYVLFDEQSGTREGDSYTVEMPIEKLPVKYDIKGKRWDILVISGTRAMETSLAFD